MPNRPSPQDARQSPRELAQLPLACPRCFQYVIITYDLNVDGKQFSRTQFWACPHCLAGNRLNLAGRIVEVATSD
jgi:hypothetical protein